MTNLKGTWLYQSYLVLPTEAEQTASPGSSVTARKWATGQLIVSEDTQDVMSGELVFAPGVSLSITGKIFPATDFLPAVFEATGQGLQGATQGSINQITGWMIPQTEQDQRPIIRGSVLAVRGTNAKPEIELGGEPIGTVGAFILTPI